MGIDAKGRNFSAPRLTPGVRHELMTYGSPAMIKDQDRQIAIMEDRARRYGYRTTANSYAKYGGITARPLGMSEGSAPRPVQRPVQVRAAQDQAAKSIIKGIIIFFVVVQFILPMLIGFISLLLADF